MTASPTRGWPAGGAGVAEAGKAAAAGALVDIGANLTAPAFHGDRAEVLARAASAGVSTIIVTGTSVRGSGEAADLADAHAGLYATAGVHPHHAKNARDAWLDDLRAVARRPAVVAIGECGLDLERHLSPRNDQLACLEAQLFLAVELDRPVFLHERAAHADLMAVLRNQRPALRRGAVVHCFTGTGAALDAYLALDLHIGITGWICDERRGTHLRDLVGRIPSDRLMIESDAPYLLPRNLIPAPKNRRNEPAFLPAVLAAVATARGEDPAETARAATATARAFFGLDSRAA